MAYAKFQFENTFSTGKEGFNPERQALELKLAQAREEGYASGVADGRRQALAEIEAQTAATLGTIVQGVSDLINDRIETEARLKDEAISLAYMIASKLAPALLKEQPFTEIQQLISDCLAAGHKEPKIVITVSEGLKEGINSKLQNILAKSGFNGEISVVSDPSFSPQDCSVSWPNGGAKRDLAALSAEIHRRIEQYLGHELQLPTDENIEEIPIHEDQDFSDTENAEMPEPFESEETAKDAGENEIDALSIEGDERAPEDSEDKS